MQKEKYISFQNRYKIFSENDSDANEINEVYFSHEQPPNVSRILIKISIILEKERQKETERDREMRI